jgi:hypothetical protein
MPTTPPDGKEADGVLEKGAVCDEQYLCYPLIPATDVSVSEFEGRTQMPPLQRNCYGNNAFTFAMTRFMDNNNSQQSEDIMHLVIQSEK